MRTSGSANTRQLLATQPVHDASATEGGGHLDKMMRILMHRPDDRGIRSQRVGAHRGQQPFGVRFSADRH